MNIDDMKEEEKNASESDTGVSEEKNANEPQDAVEADAQGSLNMGADKKETAGKDAEEVVESVVSDSLKPGAQLAAFRIAAGIDQEQVAASLKMTVRQVRELEADNYEALHGVAISRGFIRAYAKMLQVDPDPLVAMFKSEETASKQLAQIPRQNSSERFMQSSQSFGRKRGVGKTGWLILIVIVLALVYGAHSMKWFSGGSFSFKKKAEPVVEVKKQEASKSVSTELETPKVVMSEQEKTSASEENTSGKDGKAAETDPAKKDEDKPASAAEAVSPDADKQNADKPDSSSQPDKQEKTVESQPEKAVEVLPAAPQNFLVVRFNGSSRVQVLKANASILREFDGKAGDVQKLEINEPVTVVVEKAANVQMEFRKQPLVLKTARRSPEARMELK